MVKLVYRGPDDVRYFVGPFKERIAMLKDVPRDVPEELAAKLLDECGPGVNQNYEVHRFDVVGGDVRKGGDPK